MRFKSKKGLFRYVIALGLVSIVGLGWWFNTNRASANQLVPPTAAPNGLITHVFQSPDRPTRVIVIDSAQRRMAVYFVSMDSGEIQLKSVRNLHGDLQLQEFNSGDPSPMELQRIQKQN